MSTGNEQDTERSDRSDRSQSHDVGAERLTITDLYEDGGESGQDTQEDMNHYQSLRNMIDDMLNMSEDLYNVEAIDDLFPIHQESSLDLMNAIVRNSSKNYVMMIIICKKYCNIRKERL